jgi:hypothetical protein
MIHAAWEDTPETCVERCNALLRRYNPADIESLGDLGADFILIPDIRLGETNWPSIRVRRACEIVKDKCRASQITLIPGFAGVDITDIPFPGSTALGYFENSVNQSSLQAFYSAVIAQANRNGFDLAYTNWLRCEVERQYEMDGYDFEVIKPTRNVYPWKASQWTYPKHWADNTDKNWLPPMMKKVMSPSAVGRTNLDQPNLEQQQRQYPTPGAPTTSRLHPAAKAGLVATGPTGTNMGASPAGAATATAVDPEPLFTLVPMKDKPHYKTT